LIPLTKILRTFLPTDLQTLDNAHNSQAQGVNLRRVTWASTGGRRVDLRSLRTIWLKGGTPPREKERLHYVWVVCNL